MAKKKQTEDLPVPEKQGVGVISLAPALKKISGWLAQGRMFPHARSAEEIYCIIQYGAEVGIPPVTALQNIAVINGRIAMNGQLMLALARRGGVRLNVKKSDDKECIIEFFRGEEKLTESFTIEEAKKAGLLKGTNWQKYPKDMLFWRTVARGVRRIASDLISGAYLPDEITEGEAFDIAEAKVEVIEERQEQPQPKRESRRSVLLREIVELADKLGYSPDAMRARIKMLFGKEKSTQLSDQELEKLKQELETELAEAEQVKEAEIIEEKEKKEEEVEE